MEIRRLKRAKKQKLSKVSLIYIFEQESLWESRLLKQIEIPKWLSRGKFESRKLPLIISDGDDKNYPNLMFKLNGESTRFNLHRVFFLNYDFRMELCFLLLTTSSLALHILIWKPGKERRKVSSRKSFHQILIRFMFYRSFKVCSCADDER